jgi:hypothetical protein
MLESALARVASAKAHFIIRAIAARLKSLAPKTEVGGFHRKPQALCKSGPPIRFSAVEPDYGTLFPPWLPLLLRLLPRKHQFPLRGRFNTHCFVPRLPSLRASAGRDSQPARPTGLRRIGRFLPLFFSCFRVFRCFTSGRNRRRRLLCLLSHYSEWPNLVSARSILSQRLQPNSRISRSRLLDL